MFSCLFLCFPRNQTNLDFVKFDEVENIMEAHLNRGVPQSILIGLGIRSATTEINLWFLIESEATVLLVVHLYLGA